MRHGFSLVELSIVLVILGLLTGGILAGQSLVRASELRAVSSEYQRYATAMHAFRDKYFAIPGDMTNATKFWGDDATACADGAVADGTPGTCNGNGNGILTAGAASGTGECFQFWKQLGLAGLIEGSYSGLAGSGGGGQAVIGVSVPQSRMTNGGWSVYTQLAGWGGTADMFNIEMGGYFFVGSQVTNGQTGNVLLKPDEAWNVDTKLDDGHPARGRVIAKFWNNLCSVPNAGAASQNNLDARYRVEDSSVQCSLNFIRQF